MTLLSKKDPGTKYWTVVNISTSLPPVDLSAVDPPRMSPAPGREGRDPGKRLRSNSGSGSDSDVELRARRGRSRSVRSKVCSVDVSSYQPGGQVQEHEAGSALQPPASQAQISKMLEFHNESISSPVFKKIQHTNLRMNPMI